MTTTDPQAHPLDPAIPTEPPAWLNMDEIFPPEKNYRERVTEFVLEGSRLLEQLHEYMTRVTPFVRELNADAWRQGKGDDLAASIDDFGRHTLPYVGGDALRDLLFAMVGVAEEGTEGDDPVNAYYKAALGRFGLEPICNPDGSRSHIRAENLDHHDSTD